MCTSVPSLWCYSSAHRWFFLKEFWGGSDINRKTIFYTLENSQAPTRLRPERSWSSTNCNKVQKDGSATRRKCKQVTSGGSYTDQPHAKYYGRTGSSRATTLSFSPPLKSTLTWSNLSRLKLQRLPSVQYVFSAPWPENSRGLKGDSSICCYSQEVFSLLTSQALAMKPSATVSMVVTAATGRL